MTVVALAKATGNGDQVRLFDRVWDVHAPEGSIEQHGSTVVYTVRDGGRSWHVDRDEGRDCQRTELATPLHTFPAGEVVDVQFQLRMQFVNMLSRERPYIITGQIQTTNLPKLGDKPHSPIACFSWHGQDFASPKNEQVWLKTWSEREGVISHGPWSITPDVGPHFRLRYDPAVSHLVAWIGLHPVFDQRMPLGPVAPREHVFGHGIYCGEHGLPVGSGKAIVATYSAVKIG